jgi:hypothetical protein
MFRIDMSDSDFDESILERIWNKVKGGMKDKFIAVVLKYSEEKEDVEVAVDEWYSTKIVTGEESKCICSHDIEIKNYVKNRYNNNVLRIGSECINKFMGSEVKTDIKVMKSQLQYQKTGNGSHRMCSSCKRHSIPIEEEEWKTLCKTCLKAGNTATSLVLANGRKCSVCLKPTIPAEAEEWRTKCKICYKKGLSSESDSNEEELRDCVSCGLPKISSSEAEWKVKCGACYAKSKAVEDALPKRKCTSCGLLKINTTDPSWKKSCLSCFVKNK